MKVFEELEESSLNRVIGAQGEGRSCRDSCRRWRWDPWFRDCGHQGGPTRRSDGGTWNRGGGRGHAGWAGCAVGTLYGQSRRRCRRAPGERGDRPIRTLVALAVVVEAETVFPTYSWVHPSRCVAVGIAVRDRLLQATDSMHIAVVGQAFERGMIVLQVVVNEVEHRSHGRI